MEPVPGSLLVASPTLSDPHFARTIVLLLDAGHDGALGVVLNRPSEVAVGEVLSSWEDVVSGPGVLFRGGPVETDSALAVAVVHADGSEEDEPVGWRRVFEGVGLVDLDAPVELLASALSSLRIFAGYAGWSAGQLEDEIAEGAWYVVPAESADVFRPDPSGLWAQVLRRQGGQLAMLATMPAEPGHN
ncbi:YqgE/AlgH family protein [Marmoricola sp. OAE513]|uniref:YqgE/AlgH family protein n=1 Tax=Marmoricola sp. OAE513 TaxID=2817894 RepID=UPI001AEA1600